jgi:hypothetical protein
MRRLGVAVKKPRDASVSLEEKIKKSRRLGVAKKSLCRLGVAK